MTSTTPHISGNRPIPVKIPTNTPKVVDRIATHTAQVSAGQVAMLARVALNNSIVLCTIKAIPPKGQIRINGELVVFTAIGNQISMPYRIAKKLPKYVTINMTK